MIVDAKKASDGAVSDSKPTIAWQSVLAAVIALVASPAFVCTCGHLNRMALIATVPAMTIAWWGFALKLSPIGRILAIVVVVGTTLVLFKNLVDVGWFGHDPLFH